MRPLSVVGPGPEEAQPLMQQPPMSQPISATVMTCEESGDSFFRVQLSNGEERDVEKGEARAIKEDASLWIDFFKKFQYLIFPMYTLIAVAASLMFLIGLFQLASNGSIHNLFFTVLLTNLFSMSTGAWLVSKLGTIDDEIDELTCLVDALMRHKETLDSEVKLLKGNAAKLTEEADEYRIGVDVLCGQIKNFDAIVRKLEEDKSQQKNTEQLIAEINGILQHLIEIADITEKSQLLSAFLAADKDEIEGLSREEYESFEARLLKHTRQAWIRANPSFDTLSCRNEEISFKQFRVAVSNFMKERSREKLREDLRTRKPR